MELKVITSKDQLSENAVYYIEEHEQRGHNHYDWTAFYDSNFNLIENATVKYSNVLSGLKRVVKAVNKNDLYLNAYHLSKINDDFYLVEKTDYTSEAIDSISKSLKNPQA